MEQIGAAQLGYGGGFMTRAWNAPVFAVATVYFVVDGIFSYVTRPLTAWLSKRKLFERVRRWVTSLGPYPSLALFAVPLIVLKAAKPFSAYLMIVGHILREPPALLTVNGIILAVGERV